MMISTANRPHRSLASQMASTSTQQTIEEQLQSISLLVYLNTLAAQSVPVSAQDLFHHCTQYLGTLYNNNNKIPNGRAASSQEETEPSAASVSRRRNSEASPSPPPDPRPAPLVNASGKLHLYEDHRRSNLKVYPQVLLAASLITLLNRQIDPAHRGLKTLLERLTAAIGQLRPYANTECALSLLTSLPLKALVQLHQIYLPTASLLRPSPVVDEQQQEQPPPPTTTRLLLESPSTGLSELYTFSSAILRRFIRKTPELSSICLQPPTTYADLTINADVFRAVYPLTAHIGVVIVANTETLDDISNWTIVVRGTAAVAEDDEEPRRKEREGRALRRRMRRAVQEIQERSVPVPPPRMSAPIVGASSGASTTSASLPVRLLPGPAGYFGTSQLVMQQSANVQPRPPPALPPFPFPFQGAGHFTQEAYVELYESGLRRQGTFQRQIQATNQSFAAFPAAAGPLPTLSPSSAVLEYISGRGRHAPNWPSPSQPRASTPRTPPPPYYPRLATCNRNAVSHHLAPIHQGPFFGAETARTPIWSSHAAFSLQSPPRTTSAGCPYFGLADLVRLPSPSAQPQSQPTPSLNCINYYSRAVFVPARSDPSTTSVTDTPSSSGARPPRQHRPRPSEHVISSSHSPISTIESSSSSSRVSSTSASNAATKEQMKNFLVAKRKRGRPRKEVSQAAPPIASPITKIRRSNAMVGYSSELASLSRRLLSSSEDVSAASGDIPMATESIEPPVTLASTAYLPMPTVSQILETSEIRQSKKNLKDSNINNNNNRQKESTGSSSRDLVNVVSTVHGPSNQNAPEASEQLTAEEAELYELLAEPLVSRSEIIIIKPTYNYLPVCLLHPVQREVAGESSSSSSTLTTTINLASKEEKKKAEERASTSEKEN